jgi:hypothetical protein
MWILDPMKLSLCMSCDNNPPVLPLAALFIKVALAVGRDKVQSRDAYIQFRF